MKLPVRRLAWQRLSTQTVVMQVVILIVVMVAGYVVVQWNLQRQMNRQWEQRALAVADTLARQPAVVNDVLYGKPGGELEQIASSVWSQTGALFVVITDRAGIRYTHPNPLLIGKPVYDDTEPRASEPFRTGRPWTGIQRGTLGPVAAGKAPLFDAHGRLAGEVSVGFRVSDVAKQMASALPSLAIYLLLVLGGGILAALGLSRRLKRQTFGLELGEIAVLLQEREAMLHGIREGLLGYDKNERVLLANDTARLLLNLPPGSLGRTLRDMLPEGRLRDVITGEVTGSDLLVLHGDRVLVANRMPIKRDRGWVVTFQDRTESEGLKRELDEAIGLTETLRAQSHEFANRLHTLVGLVELGRYDEAVQFVTDVSAARSELTDQLLGAIGDPRLAALILAKVSLAAERDVELRLMPDSGVSHEIVHISEVITVVGNLIDNAIDAAASQTSRLVELTVVAADTGLLIRVRDSGPGVPQDMRAAVFMDGVTTKSSVTGARRGLGLALVRQVVQGRGGMISVGHDGGAVFTAVLPDCLRAPSAAEVRVTP